MIKLLETEYKCPEGYDYCENEKYYLALGIFKNPIVKSIINGIYVCIFKPLRSIRIKFGFIFCVECVFHQNYWRWICKTKILLTNI